MSIHQRIKQKRLERGFQSQEALAKAVGVVWQTVQQWENEDGTAPNRNRIKKVAEVLGTTPEWLMTGAGDDSVPEAEGRDERQSPNLQWVSGGESALLSEYRRKNESGKNSLLVMAKALPNIDNAAFADHKSQSLNLQWVSEDEAALLSEYRRMTESGKNSLLVMARALPSADSAAIADHKAK
jgi:transcriptional regulator with XRE-family HTH domain